MTDVFISYSQDDPEPTRELATALADARYAVWFDTSMLSSDEFWRVIMKKIDEAKAVITIWSEPALASDWVYAETKLAHDMGKRHGRQKLMCVRTEAVDPVNVPLPFNGYNITPLSDRAKILQTLKELGVEPAGFAAPPPPPPAPVIAADERLKAEIEAAYAHIVNDDDPALIEAFIAHYGPQNAFYLALAQKRLKTLKPSAHVVVAPARPTPAAKAEIAASGEDVMLRIDPGMHTVGITRISASADGRLLATGSHDKTGRLWALPEGRLLRTFRPPIGEGNEGKLYAIAVDPTGRWVATGGWDKVGENWVRIFDADTGALRVRLGPLPNVINDIRVSPDGSWLAAAIGGGCGLRMWGASALRQKLEGEDHDSGVVVDSDYEGASYGMAFSRDSKRIATTCMDGQVRLYAHDGASGWRLINKVVAPGATQPFGIAFSPDDASVAVGYVDALRVDLLDSVSLVAQQTLDTEGLSFGNLASVAFLSDGRLVAGGKYDSGDGSPILVWDRVGRRSAWPGSRDTMMDFAPLPAGRLAYAALDPAFGLIEANGHRCLLRDTPTGDLRGKRDKHFVVSDDGKRVRLGLREWSECPVSFDLQARRLERSVSPPAGLHQADTTSLNVKGWENNTAPTLNDAPLKLEQFEAARALAIAPQARGFVLGADWSLRSVGADGAQLWQRPVPGVVWGLNLAREGKLVLATYGDGTIRWHRASDGEELLALFIHVGPEFDYANAVQGERTLSGLEWILFTPKGFYDASSLAAEKLIGWHVNRGPDEAADFYPAETFASAFKKPAIIDAAFDQL